MKISKGSYHQKYFLISAGIFFVLLIVILEYAATQQTSKVNRNDAEVVQDSFGICRGFGTKPISEIPVGAIEAASNYFKTERAVGVLRFATEIDPIRESSTPHRCVGVRSDLDPNSLDRVLTDKLEISALAKKQQKYSGVIPAGATKALRISVLHPVEDLNYKGADPSVQSFLNNTSPYVSSDLIVAFYPEKGWIGVFQFPVQGGFPAYP